MNLSCASPTETLAYDPLGRLYQTVAGGVTRRFLYDGADIIAEYDGAGTPALQERYVHGPWADEPLVWYRGSGTSDRRYLLADERGSIIAEVGASVAKYTYDPFGAPAPATGGGRFRYTGQAWLSEIALHHYKARAYSPRLGRFLQTDPILYDAGPNLYAYVGNDPVNATDPTGLAGGGCISCEDQVNLSLVNVGSNLPNTPATNLLIGGAMVALSAGSLAAVAAPTIIPWFYANAAAITQGTAIGAEVIAPGAGGVLASGVFAQKTFSAAFSAEGAFAGRTVGDVVSALRSGALRISDVPIQYIIRDGNVLILNTRSAQALEQAGIPRALWNAVNMTGDAVAEMRLTQQLQRNGLTSLGTPTATPTGH